MGFGSRTKVRQADGSREQLTEMLQSLDTDGDNKVSWQEFREAFLGPLEDEENEREEVNEYLEDYANYLKVVFDRVDVDGSGSLSYGELVKALKEDPEFAEGSGFKDSGLSREEFADRMLDALDWDWSDEIEWEEFRDAALDSAMEALEHQKMVRRWENLRETYRSVKEAEAQYREQATELNAEISRLETEADERRKQLPAEDIEVPSREYRLCPQVPTPCLRGANLYSYRFWR